MVMENVVVHQNPAWREQANFIITAKLHDKTELSDWKWEQLWARQLTSNQFQICCIPFFTYNLALGDVVETFPEENKHYVIQKITKHSDHQTFRIWLHNMDIHEEILKEITTLGCLTELQIPNGKLIAIDTDSRQQADGLIQILELREEQGDLIYENG